MANTVGKRRESSHSQQRKHAFQEEGSAAQIRATFGRGEDLERDVQKWNRETGAKELPERVAPKTAQQKKDSKKRLATKTKKFRQ